jgi:serine kinase of HPr protein (carbohydrate metabolism regulator)
MQKTRRLTVKEIAERLELEQVCCPRPDVPVSGIYIGDLLSWVMGRAKAGEAWLTIMSNQNVAAVAVLAELSCVILGENVRPSEELLASSEERGVNLLCTGWSIYELTWRLHNLIAGEEDSEPEASK